MSVNINFKEIRQHNGSQDRAFEELCFQLIPVIDTLPTGTHLVRHGTPDGGIEAIAQLIDGGVWAWQAKFLFALTSGEFAQLDKSVKTALRSQPALTRYAFFLPYNRPAGRTQGRKSAMDRWNEHCAKWRSWATDRGMSVEFEYLGESELLNALTFPDQSGRAFYWFNKTILTPLWFESHISQAVKTAGRRYTPQLNVELPISNVFEGLGRTKEFQTRLGLVLGTIRNSREWHAVDELTRKAPQEIADTNLTKCAEALDSLDAAMCAIDIAREAPIDLDGVARKCEGTAQTLKGVAAELYKRERDIDGSKPAGSGELLPEQRSLQRELQSAAYELGNTARQVEELSYLLLSDAARVANVPVLLVVGEAGTGKTHLLCDVATRRTQEGSPTVMLFGQQFAPGEPWSQILQQLDLHCSVDDFLGALHAAAETSNARALIFIDAINEGYGVDIWQAHLVGFLNKLEKWPRVGMALSCRTGYTDSVIPHELDETQLTRITHDGFSGKESLAVAKFFGYYNLALPDFPLLIAEFRTPLFLKIMCEGLAVRGINSLPRGANGVSVLFEFFLDAIEIRLQKPDKCNYAPTDRLVQRALDELAENMNSGGREWVSWEVAKDITEKLLPNRVWTQSLLHALLDEGVLLQNVAIGSDGTEQRNAIFFIYQRLGDFLRASAICKRHDTVDRLKVVCSDMVVDRTSAYRNSGLIASLSVLVPERFGREFYELVTDSSLEPIQQGYLDSLIWRAVTSFPEPLRLDYLNQISYSSRWGNGLVLETILQVSSVPKHPLNALKLHDNLWRRPMADRDAWWTTFLNESYGNESQIDRMVEWARSSDTAFCADEAAYLCSIALAWFLSSSNRKLRDNATKGLIALLHSRPNVLRDVLVKFHGVNDQYVAERLYAVAYGCSLITADKAALELLAGTVYQLVFGNGKPPAHLLLRDYARGVIEKATVMGCLPSGVELIKVRPPYDSPWPITARSEDKLRTTYKDTSKAYSGLWFSLFTLGDFRRYIVEPRVGKFVAGNQKRRKQQARREELRRIQEASAKAQESWKLFTETLNERQKEFLSNISQDEKGVSAFKKSLNPEQTELLSNSIPPLERAADDRPIAFSADLACRWIFSRVIGLGWTPERFGECDGMLKMDRSRPPERERIGKKYQWIALYELLARLADHLPLVPDWGVEQEIYEGPWQILPTRGDIDPSLLLFSSERNVWGPITPSWWAPNAPVFPEPPTPTARLTWLKSGENLPSPVELIGVKDDTGKVWLALEGNYTWEERVPPQDDRYKSYRCHLWYQIRSYLIRNSDAQKFIDWSKGRNWMGRWMPEAREMFEVFLGEYPWHRASRGQLRTWEQPAEDPKSLPVPILVTSATYIREGRGYDQSIKDTISGRVPSSYLLDLLGLEWSGHDFKYLCKSGNSPDIVAWDPSVGAGGAPALLIDQRQLTKLTSDKGLTVIWTILGEKDVYGPTLGDKEYNGRLEVFGVVTLENGEPRLIDFKYEFRPPQTS